MPDWKEAIPDEGLRGDPSLAVFKGESWDQVGPELAKGFVNAQKMIGNRIPLPSKPEEVEQWKKDHLPKLQKAGVLGEAAPEAPDKYTLPEGTSETFDSLKLMDMIKTKTLPEFHKLGLTTKQAEGVLKHYADVITTTETARVTSHNEATSSLKKEWGVEYDANVNRAIRAVKAFGGDGIQDYLNETGWGDDPTLVRLFAKVGELISEDGYVKGGQITFDSSAESAKAEIAKINADQKHPYWDDKNPEHTNAVANMQRLFKVAYPQ